MTGQCIARRFRVQGRVQGVWFRDWTVETARRLGVDGWVRNRRDGTVEIEAVGPADAVEALRVACLEGPERARVDRIGVETVDGPGSGGGFRRRPTA